MKKPTNTELTSGIRESVETGAEVPDIIGQSYYSENKYDRNEFNLMTFCEFVIYFTINAIFGPFSYFLFFKYTANGHNIARNLNIYGGDHKLRAITFYIMKMFCYNTTLLLLFKQKDKENLFPESLSQFWILILSLRHFQKEIFEISAKIVEIFCEIFSLNGWPLIDKQNNLQLLNVSYMGQATEKGLIYTEISLIVLYAGYCCSFTETEIYRLKHESFPIKFNIFDVLLDLIKLEDWRFFNRTKITRRFPEIDPKTFYFVYSQSEAQKLPFELEKENSEQVLPQLQEIGLKNYVLVHAENITSYIAKISDYNNFKTNVTLLKVISRMIVLFRMLMPFLEGLVAILSMSTGQSRRRYVAFYALQQLFYAILMYRFVIIYDVLFVGILLYFKKYRMLSKLGEAISVKKNPETKLRICTTVPQNWQNWLNVRRIIASANEQAFVIIDTNMSFVLFYMLFFVFEVLFEKMGVIPLFFTAIENFLTENDSLRLIVNGTIFVIVIVLILDVIIGILINMLFNSDKKQLSLHKHITKSIALKYQIHEGNIDLYTEKDVYLSKIKEIVELTGRDLKDEMPVYLARLIGSLKLAYEGIIAEERDNPHSILGIPTQTAEVATMATILSTIGISTLANSVMKNSSQQQAGGK